MGNELQKELEKMNNEIEKHEDYLKSEKTTYGLADLINGKIPSKQLPSEVNLTANTLDDMNALIASGSVNDGQLCYCKADKKLYVLKDSVWSEVGGAGGKGLNILSLNLKDCMNESDFNELVEYILQKTVIAKTYNITLPDLTDIDAIRFTTVTDIGTMVQIFYRNSKDITQFNWLCNWADDDNFMQMVTLTGWNDGEVSKIKYNGINGGGGIPVVEGTESTTTTDGAYVTYTIPEAQTSCFIFKCDLGTAFISYNEVFGTYNGYLDAEGSVTDGSLKLNDLIVLSGSGTEINIFFGNIGDPGGGEGITPKPITGTADYASLTDTDYFISVNITGNSNVKNGTYILSGNKANGYSYWYPEDKSEGLNMQTYWHYIHYDSTGLTAIIFTSFLDATDNNKVGFSFNSKFPNNHIFGGFSVRQVPLFSKYTLVTNTTDEITPILPCTTADNGKVLSVVNGEAQWASASGGVTVTFED